MNLGLNLYSVRNLIKTDEDLIKTSMALKEMGYEYLQYSGAPFNAKAIKEASEKANIPFVLTHVPIERILDDTDNLMEEHAYFGCKNIGLSTIPWSKIVVEDEFKSVVDKLEIAGEKMSKNGFSLCYHNHHVDFFRHGDKTVLEYIFINAPHVNFTLDIYWAQNGGADVLSLIRKMKGRIDCVHIKDYLIAYENGKFEPRSAALGDGNLDLKSIISVLKECGSKYFLVEEENAADYPDTLAEIKRSIDYARTNLPMLCD